MSFYPGNMRKPLGWNCRQHGHMWRMVKPIRCKFCGKALVPWYLRMARRIKARWYR